MKIYFLRHAQSENNVLWDSNASEEERVEDPQLSEKGFQQLTHLVSYLKQEKETMGISHIYVSPHLRTLQTALPVAEALQINPVVWQSLHEGGGIYLLNPETGEQEGRPGMGFSQIRQQFPNYILPDDLPETGWWGKPKEEIDQRPLRALQVIDSMMKKHGKTEDVLLLISHGEFYNNLMNIILNTLHNHDYWFGMNNAGLSLFVYRDESQQMQCFERWLIDFSNKTDYLPKELLT